MRRRRRAAALALALVTVLVAGGCAGSAASAGDPGYFTENWGEPQNPLIPGDTTEEQGSRALNALFSGLVRYRPQDFKAVNEVADSITPSPDHTKYTIKLKHGWTFHDGSPVLAHNFVDAWNYTAYAPNGQLASTFFEPIQGYSQVSPDEGKPTAKTMSGLKVLDDYTFTVKLNKPLTMFPVMLGYSAFYPLPDSFYRDPEAFAKHPIGDGPFKFASRVPNQQLVLDRYDRYAGEPKPTIRGVKFKVYDNSETAYQDLISGNLDFLNQMPPSALVGDRWQHELGKKAVKKPGVMSEMLGVPLYDPRFQNPDLIKAISLAIDRKTITHKVLFGADEPADSWSTPSTPGYVPHQCGGYCHYDPARAKKLLAKAGGFPGTLTLTSNVDEGNKEFMQAITASIRQTLGIDAVFVPTPTFNIFRENTSAKKNTGLWRSGWNADYPELRTWFAQLYLTGASSNDYGYANPAFDAAMDRADAAPTIEKADKGYQIAERMLVKTMPTIPLWTQDVTAGFSDRASGVVNAERDLDLRTARLHQQ